MGCKGCDLEGLREHEEASTAEGGLLLLGHLQQALGKSSHPAAGHIGLHGLEQQAQEQRRLAGPGNLWVQQHSIQRPAHTGLNFNVVYFQGWP